MGYLLLILLFIFFIIVFVINTLSSIIYRISQKFGGAFSAGKKAQNYGHSSSAQQTENKHSREKVFQKNEGEYVDFVEVEKNS